MIGILQSTHLCLKLLLTIFIIVLYYRQETYESMYSYWGRFQAHRVTENHKNFVFQIIVRVDNPKGQLISEVTCIFCIYFLFLKTWVCYRLSFHQTSHLEYVLLTSL